MAYENLLIAVAVDLVAVTLLALTIYFPRHQRRDLALAFIGVNIGLFAVAAFVAERELNLAVGLGLFALLSVVRLRSSEIAQEDIGYYFVALVLGLVNGFGQDGEWERVLTLDAVLLAVMFVADHPRLLGRRFQQVVTLDAVYADERALQADLERRLGATVTKMVVLRTDFVHHHTTVDVRFTSPVPTGPIVTPPRKHEHPRNGDQPQAAAEPSASSDGNLGQLPPGPNGEGTDDPAGGPPLAQPQGPSG